MEANCFRSLSASWSEGSCESESVIPGILETNYLFAFLMQINEPPLSVPFAKDMKKKLNVSFV